ncbi:unnamed protein product, partial [Staurois parvus]
MTRDCGHSTGDDQRLRTQYRKAQRMRSGHPAVTEASAGR